MMGRTRSSCWQNYHLLGLQVPPGTYRKWQWIKTADTQLSRKLTRYEPPQIKDKARHLFGKRKNQAKRVAGAVAEIALIGGLDVLFFFLHGWIRPIAHRTPQDISTCATCIRYLYFTATAALRSLGFSNSFTSAYKV